MRIMITGSRTWPDSTAIDAALKEHVIPNETVVVHGDCSKGADRFAKEYCFRHRIPQEMHPANWDQYGNAAGFRRNAEMAASGIDLCLAFIHAGSKGATHAVGCCRSEHVPVKIFEMP